MLFGLGLDLLWVVSLVLDGRLCQRMATQHTRVWRSLRVFQFSRIPFKEGPKRVAKRQVYTAAPAARSTAG